MLGGAIDVAGPVLTLAALFGMGYKVGEHFGCLKTQRQADRDVEEAEILLSAARNAEGVNREAALKWKSKFEELEPNQGDRGAAAKLDRIRHHVEKSGSIWFEPPLNPPSIPPPASGGKFVITVANLKGGVGKTTITTHLAAALGQSRQVLFLDLDFQGSGSTFLLRDAGRDDLVRHGDRAKIVRLLQRECSPSIAIEAAIPLGRATPGVSVIPSYYPLADAEEQLMLRWVLGDEPNDVRFNLRRLLHSRALPWDVVVIDAPPRLSTAMTQALAASTHVLIPTQLERKSTEAALYFGQTLQQLRAAGVCHQLEILGVVPSVVPPKPQIKSEELKYLREQVAPVIGGSEKFWADVSIPERAAFTRPNLVGRANDDSAVQSDLAIRKLAGKIERRLWNAPG